MTREEFDAILATETREVVWYRSHTWDPGRWCAVLSARNRWLIWHAADLQEGRPERYTDIGTVGAESIIGTVRRGKDYEIYPGDPRVPVMVFFGELPSEEGC
ncbi:MAG TPA: hypothetical protein VEI97_03730 [bacterium]|nr:hypothetical protein [bacterium]